MGVEEEEDFLFSQRLKSGTLPTCREARLANRVLTATWHKPPIQPTLPTPINGDGRGFGLVAEGRAASTVVASHGPGDPRGAANSGELGQAAVRRVDGAHRSALARRVVDKAARHQDLEGWSRRGGSQKRGDAVVALGGGGCGRGVPVVVRLADRPTVTGEPLHRARASPQCGFARAAQRRSCWRSALVTWSKRRASPQCGSARAAQRRSCW